MVLSRSRLSKRQDYEYAITWEKLRSHYFRAQGDQQTAETCAKAATELEWRLAMLPSANEDAHNSENSLAEIGWLPSDEVSQSVQ